MALPRDLKKPKLSREEVCAEMFQLPYFRRMRKNLYDALVRRQRYVFGGHDLFVTSFDWLNFYKHFMCQWLGLWTRRGRLLSGRLQSFTCRFFNDLFCPLPTSPAHANTAVNPFAMAAPVHPMPLCTSISIASAPPVFLTLPPGLRSTHNSGSLACEDQGYCWRECMTETISMAETPTR